MADKMQIQDLAIALARMEQGWQELSRLLREQAQAGNQNGTVTAEKFVLVDAAGRSRGSLGVNADGSSGLILMDPAGKLRAWLGVKDNGAGYLSLKDEAGRIVFEAGGGGYAPREVRPQESGETSESPTTPDSPEPEGEGRTARKSGLSAADQPRVEAEDLPGRPERGQTGPRPEDDLKNRLARLERQNRIMKLAGGVMMVLLLAVLTGLGILTQQARPRPGPVATAAPVKSPVVTEALVIKGEAGATLAWLGTREGAPILEFYDQGGKVRSVLGLGQDGAPRLTFSDRQQRPRVELALGPAEEAGLSLADRDGLLRVALGNINPKYRVPPYLLERPVSSLVLFNQEGVPVWHAPLRFRR